MLKTIFSGKLIQDAEAHHIGHNRCAINFTCCYPINHDEFIQGEILSKLAKIRCKFFVKSPNVASNLRKDTFVYIEGRLDASIWLRNKVEPIALQTLIVNHLEITGINEGVKIYRAEPFDPKDKNADSTPKEIEVTKE